MTDWNILFSGWNTNISEAIIIENIFLNVTYSLTDGYSDREMLLTDDCQCDTKYSMTIIDEVTYIMK